MRTVNQDSLRELEARCTQEQPPAAMAACPLHVDCRSICAAVGNKDWDAALTQYAKTVPFPGILSYLCSQPCQQQCKRAGLGGAIELAGLERCIYEQGTIKPKRLFLPKRADQVAIIGGGISGLTAALELGKKGCVVTIFEKQLVLGGDLRKLEQLPELVLEKELKLLDGYRIGIQCNKEIGDPKALLETYDAVYVAWGQADLQLTIDHSTFQTQDPRIFAGGSGIVREGYDVLLSMTDGKRAAISIDRFLKKVSLTAGREGEEVFTTTLFTDISGVESRSLQSTLPLDPESAVAEAQRCLDCKCLECVKGCAFLTEFKTFPRKYMREVYNNLSIAMGNRVANKMINSCSLCGQCAAICPNGLDVGEFTKDARQIMVQHNKMPQSTFEFALNDMRYSNSTDCALTRHQSGYETSQYAFFPGCQLGASVPEIVKKTYLDLSKIRSGGVGLILGCCGIMADWAGEEALFKEILELVEKSWEALGKPVMITGCPTCHNVFSKYLPEMRCEGIWDVLEETGTSSGEKRGSIIIRDACGARNQPQVQQSIRTIVAQLGYSIRDEHYQKDTAPCCGFGGLTQFANPVVADKMAANHEDGLYLTYCMNCRDRYTKGGANTVHLLELYYGGDQKHCPPSYSTRRDNRFSLKRELLEDIWKEEQMATEIIRLSMRPELAQVLQERMILESDIRQVLVSAQQEKRRIRDTSRECFIARGRIGNVNYWVYYQETEQGYWIENAYSHRMAIKGEQDECKVL